MPIHLCTANRWFYATKKKLSLSVKQKGPSYLVLYRKSVLTLALG